MTQDDPALVPTPCVLDCRYDPGFGACAGCGRTLEEIAAWGEASARRRRAIREAAAARLSRRRAAMVSKT